MKHRSSECNSTPRSRREFLKNASAGAFAASAISGGNLLGQDKDTDSVPAAELPKAEKLVMELYGSLSDHQRKRIVKPYDHELRGRVENNWHILDERVGTFFERDQQQLIRDIFLNLHSEEFRNQAWDQFINDNKNKKAKTPDEIFGTASVALFATPNLDKVEFVFTGRHCTRRCDGNAEKGAAFGGPIFYGHSAQGFYEKPDHPGNVYWFQAQKANELFQMLDPKQQEAALRDDSRGEDGTRTVELKGQGSEGFEGIASYEMTSDQRSELMSVVGELLRPFRKEDQIEALAMIEAQITDLNLAFYKNEDVGDDGVWDTWQLEGPSMVWYFRGDPHVHTWVHVKQPEENTG